MAEGAGILFSAPRSNLGCLQLRTGGAGRAAQGGA